MITFIIWLRALAAMLITNAHYTGIYPTDLIANGGLIGDVIFFAVSGYCLTNMKTGFFRWYGKRLSRILPAVWLVSTVYLLIGQYDWTSYALGTERTLLYGLLNACGVPYPAWFSWILYPTYYHFVASILLLYIPFYFLLKNKWTRNHIPFVMVAIAAVYLILYIFIYDKTYYHIDNVREPLIRFLFMESMLLGAHFRLRDEHIRDRGRPLLFALGTAVVFLAYFASKVFFAGGRLPWLQPLNQVLLFALLYLVFRWFASMDGYLAKVPRWLSAPIGLISEVTLEIYLVQYVLIDVIRNLQWPFPLNWLALTASIAIAALLVHFLIFWATKAVEALISRLKARRTVRKTNT